MFSHRETKIVGAKSDAYRTRRKERCFRELFRMSRDTARSEPERTTRTRVSKFDAIRHGCYHRTAGWSSLVARWAHNPKVGGSNPPPATNPFQSVASLSVTSPAHFALTQRHWQQLPNNLPVRRPFLLAHSLRVHVESGADIRVPEQFALHFHISTIRPEQRAVAVPERVPAHSLCDLRPALRRVSQSPSEPSPASMGLPRACRVKQTPNRSLPGMPSAHAAHAEL